MDADHPARGERWSPGQNTMDFDQMDALEQAFAEPDSDVEISDLTPQAVEVEIEHQSQANHDREATGRTPAPQLKKQRNEDYDLTDSPLQEGLYRSAVAPGDWQPSIPAVVEDEEMVEHPASLNERIRQDERDEGLREVPKPPQCTYTRPRSNASSRGRPKMPRSGARSASSSNSTISMLETCWNCGPDCTPQAESRCPGKAHKPDGACRRPVCKSCSDVCPNCSNQWLRVDCLPMSEHSCTYLFIQALQDQARFVEAKTQQEFLTREAQRAEKARLDRQEMTATIEDVRKTFEAERLALAKAAREREQELVEQVCRRTAVAKRQAEEEAENRYAEMLASERQAVATAISQAVDAKTVSAAVAVAR
eukprot:3717699-Pyramimonas_sp.AAC.1